MNAPVKMTGQQIIMESLLAEGVECVFGNPGSTECGFLDAFQDYPAIRYYLSLHESVAAAMAYGYAQASGKPGVLNLHIAPGTANAMGILFSAHRGRVPLVVTAGQQYRNLLLHETSLWANLVDMVKPVTKWAVEVQRAVDLPLVLRRSFKVATTPPCGPVYVAVPVDLHAEEAEVTIGAPQRLRAPAPNQEDVAHACALLLKAERPVMVVGDGVAQSRAVPEAVEVAELLGARVFYARASQLNFPNTNPLFHGPLNTLDAAKLQKQLEASDVILAIGTSLFLNMYPAELPILSAEQKIIQIDVDTWEIGKNYPVALGIIADPKIALREILRALEARLTPELRRQSADRAQACREEKDQLRRGIQATARIGWDDTPISDARLFAELKAVLPAGALLCECSLTAEMGHHVDLTEPGSYLRLPAPAAYLGWCLASALGMKLARPDRPVVAVLGDGELMFGIQALWTAAHYHIPITCVVINNGVYGTVKTLMHTYLRSIGKPDRRPDYVGMSLADPVLDFGKIARDFGLWGTRVERPEDLGDALKQAVSLDRPALVDVAVEESRVRTARIAAARQV